MDMQLLLSSACDLAESPQWSEEESALYFIDITRKTINRVTYPNLEYKEWEFSEYIGGVVLKDRGGLIATIGQNIVEFKPENGQTNILAQVIPDNRPDLRMNDCKCDRLGRLWLGVANLDLESPKGGLFKFSNNKLTQMEEGITISNGLGFSPDNKIFYYTDSLKRIVYAYDFDLIRGEISNRRVFIKYPDSEGEPDGLTIDSLGNLWQAIWNGGKICIFNPSGELIKTYHLPISRPTSLIFGGENYSDLFVTSCQRSINESENLLAPSGNVFLFKNLSVGLPEAKFTGIK